MKLATIISIISLPRLVPSLITLRKQTVAEAHEQHSIWDSTASRDEPYGYRLTRNMLPHPIHKEYPGSCLQLPVLPGSVNQVEKRK